MNIEQVAAAEAAGEAEFAAAFGEATAPDAAAAAQAPAADQQDSLDTAGFDEPANGDDNAPAAPAAGTSTAGRAPAPPVDDLEQRLASADPVIVAAFNAARQASKSDRGRIAAFQRQVAELKAAPRINTATDASGTSADLADLLDDPALREATEAYGDVLNPMLAVMQKMQAKIQSLEGSVTADQSARAERAAAAVIEAEETAVRDAHSDLDAVINSQSFADWASDNPHVMPTIQANGEKIVDATAVTKLLSQFKRETAWVSPPSAAGNPARGNPNDARRNRQIASTVNAVTGGPGASTSQGMDSFESAFAEAVVKLT